MANIRIKDQTTDTALVAGDYVIVDNETEGTRKFDLGQKLIEVDADIGNLSELTTTNTSNLVNAINEVNQGGGSGSGLTQTEKELILTLFSKAAYAEDDAEESYEALASLWQGYSVTWQGSGYSKGNNATSVSDGATFRSTITASTGFTIMNVVATMGGNIVQGAWQNGTITIPNVTGNIVITVTTSQATVSSISAVYTQSGMVYDNDTLDSLKSDLVVTATYVDQSTYIVPSAEYTLSGTLTAGTSTITVSYGGFTTTFSVQVSQSGGLPSGFTPCDYVQSNGGAYIDTGIKELYGTIASFWGIFDAHVASTNTKTLWGYQGTAAGYSSSYRFTIRVTTDNEIKYYGAQTGLSSAISGWSASGTNEITVSLVDNDNYPTFDVNGTQSTGNKAKTTTLAPEIGPIYLLADNYNAVGPGDTDKAVDGSYIKCYGFKIYNVSGIVRDYKPCTRNSDSVAGFYDMVSETFYPSIGANQFTSGNDEV